MIQTSDLQQREVININNGKRLGTIADFEINLEEGRIESVFIPGPGKIFGLFGKNNDHWIPWDKICVIGEDVILVDLDHNIEIKSPMKPKESKFI